VEMPQLYCTLFLEQETEGFIHRYQDLLSQPAIHKGGEPFVWFSLNIK
jgi:hypothetical protein